MLTVSDLQYLEATRCSQVEGGFARAKAFSGAHASGTYFAEAFTFTDASAYSSINYYYPWHYCTRNKASSGSFSSSRAK
ncbi:MAG TPA: hypothetical protein IGS53_04915 [Leptolyngbyaceae cyanobacterium M33_DOE_097]|uniref:Uncharacterized protein n=1 Tax=Oscillatoriales cyanobacterium SpSt-418 TaxID=2282169 RepID=A0A7C3KBG5_9CYAN|nr:hypothetical protein [Leptolyngbyaceae cyanobacterium M33_DOE_097]